MKLLCAVIFAYCLSSCVTATQVASVSPSDTLTVSFAKWHKNSSAAVSMTFDHTWGRMVEWERTVPKIVADSVLPVDFDYTSGYIYDNNQHLLARDTLQKLGIAFFAHGHRHINNDTLSYEQAKANFLECRDSMRSIGINPLVYAYPGGYGYKTSTQRAAEDAGFLAARMFDPLESPHVLPNAVQTVDWYRLPTLMMFRKEFQDLHDFLRVNRTIVNNTAQLVPHLRENTRLGAWLILTYHMIGPTDNENTYEVRDLLADIGAIRSQRTWLVRMQDAVVYLREKEAARLSIEHRRNASGRLEKVILSLNDGLPDDVYSLPLTLLMTSPVQWKGKTLRAYPINNPNSPQMLVPAEDGALMLTIPPDGKQYVVIAE